MIRSQDCEHDLAEAVRSFTESAILHGKLANEGMSSQKINRAFDRAVKAYRQIRQHGDDGQRALCKLMRHENDSVRYWAARHCLPFAEQEAIQVLTTLAAGIGPVAFNAELALDGWKDGTYRLD